ncbi:hypothetical protein BC332_25356 [Capsicum chinense]|nr:hypothetical protein BC332_25356 [Capsicum chinense]
MGLTLYLGIERGNIACHKSEARVGTLLREGCLTSRAFRDEAFWQSQVNFGPPNPATNEKDLWSKGKHVRCDTLWLLKVSRGWARCSRATTGERVPHWKGDRRPTTLAQQRSNFWGMSPLCLSCPSFRSLKVPELSNQSDLSRSLFRLANHSMQIWLSRESVAAKEEDQAIMD